MIEHLITSTVLIVCILLIRMLFGNRTSQRLKYGLWLLAAVKLLLPLPLYETDFSIMNGNRAMIKRKCFEKFLDSATAV